MSLDIVTRLWDTAQMVKKLATINEGSLSGLLPLVDLTTFLDDLMHKAAYNTSFDAFYGPDSTVGAPGVRYRTAAPCRKVPQTEITQAEFPNSISQFWMTFDPPSLNTAIQAKVVSGIYTYDFNYADRIAIPTGTAPQWTAVRQETITPFGLPAYRRVLLCSAAFAAPVALLAPVAPGATCLLAPTISLGVQQTFNVVAGAPARWWKMLNVTVGEKYLLHTSYTPITGIAPVLTNGGACGTAVAAGMVLLSAGNYIVTITQTGTLFINLPVAAFGPFFASLSVDTWPYRP